MTRKIARFFADHEPATPCLVVDLDVVAASYRKLRKAMPDAVIYYAVKANPARDFWSSLVVPGMGTIQGFCASSQASAIWAGVAFFRSAMLVTRSTKCGVGPAASGSKRGTVFGSRSCRTPSPR